MATAKLTVGQALAWRMRRHLLHRPAGTDPVRWPESPPPPADALAAERARVTSYLSGNPDA